VKLATLPIRKNQYQEAQMTHKYVAITKVGSRFEQCCKSMKEGLDIHKKLLESGWQIEQYEIFELEDGPEIPMSSSIH
jgi:hypothetical protein